MPQVITQETTVYTFEEIKAAFSWQVQQKAINEVLAYCWEGFEPEFVTDDMAEYIKSEYPLFDLQGNTRRNLGQTLFWDMERLHVEAKGSVRVYDYLQSQKLCNKYRSLWNVLKKYDIHFDCPAAFGNGGEYSDLYELQREIDFLDEIYENKPRYQRICQQIEALEADIAEYVKGLQAALVKYLRAENDYRSSDEYAKEEAEALELKFEEDGTIFHG